LVRYYRNRVFRAFFHAPPENRLGRDGHTRLAGLRARVVHAFCQCWSVACRLRRYERGNPHCAAAEAASAVRQHVCVP
jgi:hypothetical protein